jgi:hypothetical protein
VQKIARARDARVLAVFAPTHQRLAREHVGDRVLLAVVVDAGLRSRLDQKRSAPKAGVNLLIL